MISFELLEAIRVLMRSLYSNNYLFKVLTGLSDNQGKLISLVGETISQGTSDSVWDHCQTIRAHLSDVVKQTHNIKHKKLFLEIGQIEEALSYFPKNTSAEYLSIPWLQLKLTEFSSAYEDYLSGYGYSHTISFLDSSQQLLAAIASTIDTLNTIVANLENQPADEAVNQETISIIFYSDMDLAEFTAKLGSLNRIYNELCQLLQISYKENPLQIGKIESGSLWAKLFGEPRVITLIISLIERGIDFLHRTYTKEGRLSLIPKKIEATNEVLKLKQELDAMGIDTSQMEENLQKSGSIISSELNTLLAKEPVVVVNGREHSVASEVEKQYIESSKQLYLTGTETPKGLLPEKSNLPEEEND